MTQGGEHLRLAEVEPVGGLVDMATVVLVTRPRRCNNFDQYRSVQGMGPPAMVTPGRLLASPVSPRKGRTDWLRSPSTTTRWPAPGANMATAAAAVVVVVVVVIVIVIVIVIVVVVVVVVGDGCCCCCCIGHY